MLKFFSSITKFLKAVRMAELDAYITARNPQSEADVERFIREYDRKQRHLSRMF